MTCSRSDCAVALWARVAALILIIVAFAMSRGREESRRLTWERARPAAAAER